MSHLKSFLVSQLEMKEIELNSIENKLKEFQESQKIFSLDNNSNNILHKLTKFETEYNTILASIDIVNEKEKFLNNQLTNDELKFAENVSNMINTRLNAMRTEMYTLENELISTKTKYGDNHSAVLGIKNKLNVLKNTIEEETKKLIINGKVPIDPISFRQSLIDTLINIGFIKSDLNSKADAYLNLVKEYDKQLTSLPEKILEYTKSKRSHNRKFKK